MAYDAYLAPAYSAARKLNVHGQLLESQPTLEGPRDQHTQYAPQYSAQPRYDPIQTAISRASKFDQKVDGLYQQTKNCKSCRTFK